MTILDYSFWYIDYQPFSLNLRVVTKRCNWQGVEKILCWVEILKGILDENCLKWGKFKDFVYISRSSLLSLMISNVVPIIVVSETLNQ